VIKRLDAFAPKTLEDNSVNLSSCREFLAIERDNLDACLVEQPEVYYRVAQAFSIAVAERDAVKLDLEEARAELDIQFRKQAAEAEEKMTEASLQQKLRVAPKMQKLERDFLQVKAIADDWQALKESFQQRSFMLRELVALQISQRYDEGAAGGAQSSHARLAGATKDRTDALRRERRQREGV